MLLNFLNYSLPDIIAQDFKENWQLDIKQFLIQWVDKNPDLSVRTSGSTGVPKTIFYPKSAFSKSANITGRFLSLQKGDSALLCLPINYIAGKMMVVRAIELNLKLFCVEPKLNLCVEDEVDFCAMTPLQVEKSLIYIPKIKKLIVGGMPISYELEKKVASFPNKIFETFGMTESLSHIAMRNITQKEHSFKLLPEMRIAQDTRGCLLIKTPYFEEEIITNDIVEIVNNQSFIWKGRWDNVINSGGVKLFPEEIEKKLKPFLDKNFYISSKKNKELSEEVVLCIESSKSEFIDENIFSEGNLTKFEKPKTIIYQTSFQYTPSGKIIRERF